MSIYEIEKLFEQKKGQQLLLNSQAEKARKKSKKLDKEIFCSEKAQVIIQEVARKTQQELEYHVSELVTLALSAVFEEPYEFKLEFTIQRNKTVIDIWFSRDGQLIKPMDAAGGGVVDIASFALRVALWSLAQPKSRGLLILDEPFKFLSRDLQPKASLMLKELSEKLGLQIIMVSHSEDLIDGADKVFKVKIKNGISEVVDG